MKIEEVSLTEAVLEDLILLSQVWESENSCYGYRANKREDIEGNRIFLAWENGKVIGYLFGHPFRSKNMGSIMPEDSLCFEVEEIFVVSDRRSQGIGSELFRFAEEAVKDTADYMVLSTATKNWRAVFHFYIEELGMTFWSARLFKRIE